jgi:hypothetical protein
VTGAEAVASEPVYRQMLGSACDALDAPVRRFHSLQGRFRLQGRCSVSGAEHPIGRFVCWLLRLPRAASEADFAFELAADPSAETWTRHFPGRTMRSRLEVAAGRKLRERLGPALLLFSLHVADGSLSMQLEAIRLFGLPWPSRWFPEVWAIECGDDGRFCFDAGARLRVLGSLVAYSGYLELAEGDDLP